MAFVNTVDLIGEEELTNKIICRTITEIADNIVKRVGDFALSGCGELAVVDFPSVTRIHSYAFADCSKLTALILRCETICTLVITNALNKTPIKSGTGYIYVPRALVDNYKSASNWSTYANQIRAIEDYPEICGG